MKTPTFTASEMLERLYEEDPALKDVPRAEGMTDEDVVLAFYVLSACRDIADSSGLEIEEVYASMFAGRDFNLLVEVKDGEEHVSFDFEPVDDGEDSTE